MSFLHRTWRPAQRAFTLIEMMIVIALVGIITLLVAPNMTEMIGMQRLRAINDQLLTDLHYMRGEAVSRNQFMGLVVRNEAAEPVTCYAIISNANAPLQPIGLVHTQCDCKKPIGSVCTAPHRELRTVQLPRSGNITLHYVPEQGPFVIASPVTGGSIVTPPDTSIAADLEYCIEVRRSPRGRLRSGINLSGRTSSCSPDGSVPGVPTCPPYDPATLQNCQFAP